MTKKQLVQHSESNQDEEQSNQEGSSSHFETQGNNGNPSNSQSGAKSGRPPKQKQISKQKFDIKLVSPTSELTHKIKEKLMQFFHSIGKKNGLTLSNAIRKSVNRERKQANKAPFNQKNQRKYTTEKNKVLTALQKFKILNKLKNKFSENPLMLKKFDQFKETIFSIIYESNGITSQDFTEQMYRFFIDILNILYEFIGQNKQIEKALQKFGYSIRQQNSQYQYLNFNFGQNSRLQSIRLQNSESINKRFCQVSLEVGKLLQQYLQQNRQKMFYTKDN